MDSTLIPKRHAAVTPSNTDSLGATMGLYVGGAGDVAAVCSNGATVTYTCPAGTQIVCEIHQVLDTGTTATGIIAFYPN